MASSSTHNPSRYYVPEQSAWPFKGALAMGILGYGAVQAVQSQPGWGWALGAGLVLMVYIISGWFKDVIDESMNGLYNAQMDRSFRMTMAWFIFSEVMFFVAFFGTLYYIRFHAVPNLGGEGFRGATHFLWPQFVADWPLLQNPDPKRFPGPQAVIDAWGLPALNTAILLLSGVTITWAHAALKKNQQGLLLGTLGATVVLGVLFLGLQGYEYHHAYHELGLTLGSGIYGSTFFMLTGFHGLHVTIGTIMLIVIWFRALKRHFTAEKHFAFEAVAWYWHFVDVVWLGLFISVYWL